MLSVLAIWTITILLASTTTPFALCKPISSDLKVTKLPKNDWETQRRSMQYTARRQDLTLDEKLGHFNDQLGSGRLSLHGHDVLKHQFDEIYRHQVENLFSVDKAKVALLEGSKDLGFHDGHHAATDATDVDEEPGAVEKLPLLLDLQDTPTPESNHTKGKKACARPANLIGWTYVSPDDKRAFIDAIKCLTTIPSKLGGKGSLYDDFTGTHVYLSYFCHRALTVAFYRALRHECDYRGPMVFWDMFTNVDESDPKSFTRHAIFDDELGFGGDGDRHDGDRVNFGPFAGMMVNYTRDEVHPGRVKYNPHFVTRHFALHSKHKIPHSFFMSPDAIKWVLQAPNYHDFDRRLQLRVHGSAHHAIGGQFNFLESVNDAAMFWSLHGLIDCVWQKRQHMAGGRFKHDFEGWELPHRMGDRCTKDTLVTTLGLYLADAPVGMYIDTTKAGLCYQCEQFDFLGF